MALHLIIVSAAPRSELDPRSEISVLASVVYNQNCCAEPSPQLVYRADGFAHFFRRVFFGAWC